MKLKHAFLIILLTRISIIGIGQNLVLNGKVVDSKTAEPLSFSTIEIKSLKTGTIADKNGDFLLTVNSQNVILDTIEFSYLGYFKTKMSINDFKKLNSAVIKLNVNVFELNEIVVVPKKYKLEKIGVTDGKNDRVQYANIFNGNLENFIENKKQKNGFIKSVSYYIGEEGHPETPFRIRIYGLDKVKGCPGEDLLKQNIIVYSTKSGWFNVDVSKYNIPFPIDGAFVMMEWINSGNQYYYEKEFQTKGESGGQVKKVIHKFYGQTLGGITKQPKMITWGRGLGNEWMQYYQNYKGYLNVMINAEIAFEKE